MFDLFQPFHLMKGSFPMNRDNSGYIFRKMNRLVIGFSQKTKNGEHQNLLHPGFCSNLTGLNREKRCKLAAVFVQNSSSVERKSCDRFFLQFLQLTTKIYLYFCDLSICSNAYSHGYHRTCHAAPRFLSKTRYNFIRLGGVLFLYGPWTAGYYILPSYPSCGKC